MGPVRSSPPSGLGHPPWGWEPVDHARREEVAELVVRRPAQIPGDEQRVAGVAPEPVEAGVRRGEAASGSGSSYVRSLDGYPAEDRARPLRVQ